MTAHNVIPFRRDPLDRGTMGEWWISREQERAKAHAEHCRRMFHEEPGYDFVDPLPDELPRFAGLQSGRLMRDPTPRPSFAIWACIVLGAAMWPVVAWAVAAIIQGSGQ